MRLAGSRATIAALTLAAALALAACEEEDGPSSPSTSDTPSVPESSSPSEPSTVANSTEPPNDVDPVAVVRTWVTSLNAILTGADPVAATELATANCWTCDEHIDPILTTLAEGGWYRGGRWTVDRARVADREESKATVYAAISAASGTTLTRPGTEPVAYEADKFILDFRLKTTSAGWRIAKIVYLS